MAYKTREELLKEIESKNKEIKDLKKEVEKVERYKNYESAADELGAMREAFINSGFSKTEAFEMTKLLLSHSLKNTNLF